MFTADRDVLATEQVGRTRFRTPAGYLYCTDVRIASTESLLYLASEIPEIEAKDGMVLMLREPGVLFDKTTITSFEGMDVTLQHPPELLDPSTVRDASVGVVINVRRGEGVDINYLVADLLIKDAAAITEVESGLREVSCGYDGDREPVEPGVGRFTRIIGNHVALVDRGRCGPACAIGDEETVEMTKKKSLIDRLRDAFKTKDEAGFNAGLVELSGVPAADEEEVTAESIEKANEEPKMDDDPMKGWSEKFDALCARMDKFEAGGMAGAKGKDEEPAKEEKKEGECDEDLSGKNPDGVKGDEDPDMKEKEKSEKEEATSSNDHYVSMDAAAFRSEFQATLAKAEVLAPGIKLPMFDTRASTDKASRKTLADKMCGLRRDAVKKALDGKHKEAIKAVVGDRDVAKMSCDSVSMLFDAAAIVAKAANNTARVAFDHTVFKQGPVTAATLQEINEAARKARK